jgi:hypothetical protein
MFICIVATALGMRTVLASVHYYSYFMHRVCERMSELKLKSFVLSAYFMLLTMVTSRHTLSPSFLEN